MHRSLVSIAVLETIFQQTGKGTLDLLVPFAVNLAEDAGFGDLGPDAVHALCRAFEKTYGFRVPFHVMTTVLQKAKRGGLIALSADGTKYAPVAKRVSALGFKETVAKNTARWTALMADFATFCDDQGCSMSEAQAEAGFLAFLKEHDADILLASGSCSVLPRFAYKQEHLFLANAFITSLSERGDSRSLEFVVEFALGHALASTIMNWNMSDYVGHLKGLYAYLDTPLLLQLMGLSIPVRVEAAEEFVQVLRARGAVVCVFEHVVEEAVDVLNGAKVWLGDSGFKPWLASQTSLFVVEHSWSVTDIERCIAGLAQTLEESGLHRVSAPAGLALKEYNISTQNLTDCIVEEYKRRSPYFKYHEKKWTIERDVWSIAAIHKLRKGRRSASLGAARHVFISPNSGLAIASRHFEEREGDFTARTIPACVTDTLAATIAWVEAPDAGKHMNTKRVVSEALAAIQPTPALMGRLYDDLHKHHEAGVIDDTEYRALVADSLAREMLAQTTRNDPTRYNAQTSQEIISEYRARYEKAAASKLEAEQLLRESREGEIASYQKRNELIARRAALAIGVAVGIIGLVIVVVAAAKSVIVWTVLGGALAVVGGSVWAVSKKAGGWVYAAVLRALTPTRDLES